MHGIIKGKYIILLFMLSLMTIYLASKFMESMSDFCKYWYCSLSYMIQPSDTKLVFEYFKPWLIRYKTFSFLGNN